MTKIRQITILQTWFLSFARNGRGKIRYSVPFRRTWALCQDSPLIIGHKHLTVRLPQRHRCQGQSRTRESTEIVSSLCTIRQNASSLWYCEKTSCFHSLWTRNYITSDHICQFCVLLYTPCYIVTVLLCCPGCIIRGKKGYCLVRDVWTLSIVRFFEPQCFGNLILQVTGWSKGYYSARPLDGACVSPQSLTEQDSWNLILWPDEGKSWRQRKNGWRRSAKHQ